MGRARERKRAARAAASTASPKTPRSRWAATLAVVILAILPYLNTLRNGFALDDIDIVQQNQLIRDLGNVGRVFSTDYWGGAVAPGAWHDPGLYRPLTVTTLSVMALGMWLPYSPLWSIIIIAIDVFIIWSLATLRMDHPF